MDHVILNQALTQINELEADLFFEKLSQYGITAENQDRAEALFDHAQGLLAEYPWLDPRSAPVKTASAQLLGKERKLASDGYSEEAHACVNQLMNDPAMVQAVRTALAAQNV